MDTVPRVRRVHNYVAIALCLTLTACGSGSTGFSALESRYLPGTTGSTWTALVQRPLAGTSEALGAKSKNGRFYVWLFFMPSTAVASAFYQRPGGGTIIPIPGATRIAAPSRGVLVGACGTGLACTAEEGIMVLRARVVIFAFWLSSTRAPDMNGSDLLTVAPYAEGCLALLSEVGLPS